MKVLSHRYIRNSQLWVRGWLLFVWEAWEGKPGIFRFFFFLNGMMLSWMQMQPSTSEICFVLSYDMTNQRQLTIFVSDIDFSSVQFSHPRSFLIICPNLVFTYFFPRLQLQARAAPFAVLSNSLKSLKGSCWHWCWATGPTSLTGKS